MEHFVTGHFNGNLVGHTKRSVADTWVEGDLNSGDLTQEVSKKTINMRPRIVSCIILVKNVAISALVQKVCL